MEKPSEKKILIVEDEISLADIMKERLESEGFKVFVDLCIGEIGSKMNVADNNNHITFIAAIGERVPCRL